MEVLNTRFAHDSWMTHWETKFHVDNKTKAETLCISIQDNLKEFSRAFIA